MIYAEYILEIIFCDCTTSVNHVHNRSTRIEANRQPVADSPTLIVDELGIVFYICRTLYTDRQVGYT